MELLELGPNGSPARRSGASTAGFIGQTMAIYPGAFSEPDRGFQFRWSRARTLVSVIGVGRRRDHAPTGRVGLRAFTFRSHSAVATLSTWDWSERFVARLAGQLLKGGPAPGAPGGGPTPSASLG